MSNFNYLKKFNPDAYDLAVLIEEQIIMSPAAVKSYATTFLEDIVNDMLEKTGHKIENPYVVFSMRVQKLSEFAVIDYKFKTLLLNAYKLRNTIHDDFGKIKESELQIALDLHRKLFDISWMYFEQFCEDYSADYFGKPEYQAPYKLETLKKEQDNEEEFKGIVQRGNERLFDKCIICGKSNNTFGSNLCRDCENKLDNVENLLNMRNNIDNLESFTKRELLDLGYSKAYANQLMIELINENIVSKSSDKIYKLNEENFNKFIEEIKEYLQVDFLLTEFVQGKFKFNQIKNTSEYKKGLKGQKPFVVFTHVVNDIIFKEFLNEVKLNIPINEILEDTNIDMEDVHAWYESSKKEYLEGNVNEEFVQYNKILMDRYIELRRQAKTREEIYEELQINEDYLDFWKNSMRLDSEEFFRKIEEIQMNLVIDAIYDKKTKEEALEIADISTEELNRMCELGSQGDEKYKSFYNIFEREYTSKRRKDFIFALNENSLDKSFEKSKLSRSDYELWYSQGEKQFLQGKITDKNTYDFYVDVTERLMKKYVNYRINGKTKQEAASSIGKTEKDINDWLKLSDKDLFKHFKEDLHNATGKILVLAIKKGLTKKEAAKLADINVKQLEKYLKRGSEGDEAYTDLYDAYLNSYVPSELDKFLRVFKKKNDRKKALKTTSLTNDELEKCYNLGLDGDELFSEFAIDYQDYKIELFINQILKGKSKIHAVKNAELTDRDLEILGDLLDEKLLERQIEIVYNEIINDKTTKQAAKKAKVEIESIFEWYEKGRDGDERFKEFSEMYFDSYIEIGSEFVDEHASDGVPIKSIVKKNKDDFTMEDVEFWQKLGYVKTDYVVNITPGYDEEDDDEEDDKSVEIRWI
jgi:hypothetical protein